MLAISDLHVAYGQSEVLHGLNVSVAPNEIVAIMGRISAYTGQIVRWSDVATNEKSPWYNLALKPAPLDFEQGTVVAPQENAIPLPGQA